MPRPTVLVVEDDAGLRLALEHGLTAEGFEVAVAPDARTACEHAAAARPDLVLLDWTLPDGDGQAACHRLREVHPDGRVVMLTGRTDGADDARAAGAVAYCVKGMALSALADELRRVLGE